MIRPSCDLPDIEINAPTKGVLVVSLKLFWMLSVEIAPKLPICQQNESRSMTSMLSWSTWYIYLKDHGNNFKVIRL